MYHKKKSKSSFKHVKGKINFFRFTDININYSYEILINTPSNIQNNLFSTSAKTFKKIIISN